MDERQPQERRYLDRFLLAVAAFSTLGFLVSIIISIGTLKTAGNADEVAKEARTNQANIEMLVQNLVDAEIRSCGRVQELREEVNEFGEVIYRVLVAAAASNSSATAAYRGFADQLDYQPPTNCSKAILDAEYERPPEVPWRERLGRNPLRSSKP